jgi:hypothetical protein
VTYMILARYRRIWPFAPTVVGEARQ